MSVSIVPSDVGGGRIITLDVVGTAVFTVTAIAGAISSGTLRNIAAVVAFTLFAIGSVLFLIAYGRAVARSRFETISVGGLYFLSGCAPRSVQVRLLGLVVLQTVVAIATSAATASVRPFTPLAFGLLVPMFGLGCCGLWGAFHGTFPKRTDPRASLPADD
jgi:hypothetical protein